LPVPLAVPDDGECSTDRFHAISRYQHAVNHSRGADGDGDDTRRNGDQPVPAGDGHRPRPTEGSR
jgi:hypothetical protein